MTSVRETPDAVIITFKIGKEVTMSKKKGGKGGTKC